MNDSSISKNNITSLAIGGFDGLHIAHQKIINTLDENGALLVINKGFANLTPNTREECTKRPIFYYQLNEIKGLSAEDFIKKLMREFPKLSLIVVGYDFRFGKNRSGDAHTIAQYFKGRVITVEEVRLENISVHSQTIREYLQEGDITTANKLLGRPYSIKGDVIKGQGIGSRELVSTINIHTKDFLIPKEGVYTSRISMGEHSYQSVSFIGKRVSTDEQFAIETHILSPFTQTDDVKLSFLHYQRPNQKFDTLPALKAQIKKDIQDAKEIHAKRHTL